MIVPMTMMTLPPKIDLSLSVSFAWQMFCKDHVPSSAEPLHNPWRNWDIGDGAELIA